MLTTHFRIAAEEIVAAYENSDNGSGPMVVLRFTDHREGWGTGFRQPAPSGQGYSTTLQHTLAIFLLWKGQVAARECESEFRRARACPLIQLPGGRLLLSANPSSSMRSRWADGGESHYCEPQLLEFNASAPEQGPASIRPR